MNNPGDFSLCDQTITGAQTATIFSPIVDLDGMLSATIMARFAYGSGGATAKAWVQTTFDDGASWVDVACFAFTTASGLKAVNLSALTPVTAPVTLTDGTMADNAVQDGLLGTALRVKLTTTGTYATSLLSVKAVVR